MITACVLLEFLTSEQSIISTLSCCLAGEHPQILSLFYVRIIPFTPSLLASTVSLTPSLRPPISEPLEPQHPASKLGIHIMADLAIYQDPKEDLWIAMSSHPGGQESKLPPLLPISRPTLSILFVSIVGYGMGFVNSRRWK